MRSRLESFSAELADSLWGLGEPVLYCIWLAQSRCPSLFGWGWRMVHRPEWRRSTAQSVSFWIITTLVIFRFARWMGGGVTASIEASLAADWLVYGINKLWVWRKRSTSVARSSSRNMVVSGITFGLNMLLTYLVVSRVGLHTGRVILGGYGVMMNPVMFGVRHYYVFAEPRVMAESQAAYLRLEDYKANFPSRLLLIRTGA